MADYKNQHYVPKWYQRKFIPDNKGEYWCLDLKPTIIKHPDGKEEIKDISRKSVKDCFSEDFFYKNVLFRDPNFLEKAFYGNVDDKGAKDIQTLFDPYGVGSNDRFLDFLDFLDTLRFRTPKGTELVKRYRFPNQTGRISLNDIILDTIRRIRGMHQTMWIEGVWLYLSADKSATKFIASDHPVTLFNKKIDLKDESLDMFMLLGTILLFPLDLNNCLVIFHRDYGIDRKSNPLQRRINARIYNGNPFLVPEKLKNYDGPMRATTKELRDNEVIAVNHLIKGRAHKFITSYNKKDLFPEKLLKDTDVANIENIVLPDPNMVVGVGDSYLRTTSGKYLRVDPYGRPINSVEAERKLKEMEEEVKRIRNNKKDID
ncbi:MAG: DUF4238 domain-containing protein [Elusimicrobiota bacterium]|jgi:hypothetical protein|nr:DUF4238 domain-containing protein [Elusimicrobiota bacterium]